MRAFRHFLGDVNVSAYGGTWFRLNSDYTQADAVELINWPEEIGQKTVWGHVYVVECKRINLTSDALDQALDCHGWTRDDLAGLSRYAKACRIAEVLRAYGAGVSHLHIISGNNWRELVKEGKEFLSA